jgi:hypothetical protein
MEIANFAVATVAMIAACAAAYFAFKCPTQGDIKRVEKNTADTSAELSVVRAHISQVEDHLANQNKREELAAVGRNVSMRVGAEGWNDHDFRFVFVVNTPGVLLKGIELVNHNLLLSGGSGCVESIPGTFTATVVSSELAKWAQSGEFMQIADRRTANIHAILEFEKQRLDRTFAAVIVTDYRQRPGRMTAYYTVTGGC